MHNFQWFTVPTHSLLILLNFTFTYDLLFYPSSHKNGYFVGLGGIGFDVQFVLILIIFSSLFFCFVLATSSFLSYPRSCLTIPSHISQNNYAFVRAYVAVRIAQLRRDHIDGGVGFHCPTPSFSFLLAHYQTPPLLSGYQLPVSEVCVMIQNKSKTGDHACPWGLSSSDKTSLLYAHTILLAIILF